MEQWRGLVLARCHASPCSRPHPAATASTDAPFPAHYQSFHPSCMPRPILQIFYAESRTTCLMSPSCRPHAHACHHHAPPPNTLTDSPHCEWMSACVAIASPNTLPSDVTTATPVSSQLLSMPSTMAAGAAERAEAAGPAPLALTAVNAVAARPWSARPLRALLEVDGAAAVWRCRGAAVALGLWLWLWRRRKGL